MRKHPTSRGNSRGVRAWGERAKEGLGGVQELNQLAAPSFRAEQEWEGGGLGAEGSKALVVKEGAVGDHMLDGVGGRGGEIIRWIGGANFPCCVAGAEGGIIRLGSEVHRIVGVEGMTRGELDGCGEEMSVASRETAKDVRGWGGIVWWLAGGPSGSRVLLGEVFSVPI